MIALLTSAAIGLAVALAGLQTAAIVRRALEAYRARYDVRTLGDVRELLLVIDRRGVAGLSACLAAAASLAGLAIGGIPAAVLLAGIAAAVPPFATRWYRARRIALVDRQLAPALQTLSSALRAGLTLAQALEQLAREEAPPLGRELALVARELRLGVALDVALESMARRVGSRDLELVVASVAIARQLGGNLAELAETLAAGVRERLRLEGRVQALTAQGKLQGWIVGALPLLLGVALSLLRPDLVLPMFDHAFGWGLVVAVIFLEGLGALLIRRIVQVDV